jgi:hypothetical protein
MMVIIGPLHEELAVMYLFTRYKFNWSEIEFSVFAHLLKIHNALISFMCSTSKILSSFVYCFAQNTHQFYLGPLVEILNGTSFISMRSIASKLIGSDELGENFQAPFCDPKFIGFPFQAKLIRCLAWLRLLFRLFMHRFTRKSIGLRLIIFLACFSFSDDS